MNHNKESSPRKSKQTSNQIEKDLYKEFSKFGTVKSVTGALNVRMGRVFIAFLHKEDALQAFLNKTDKCFVNMRFALPKCEKDYFDT